MMHFGNHKNNNQKIDEQRKKLGKVGEKLVKDLLVSKGFIFISQNTYIKKITEIDLIFKDKYGNLGYFEVKTGKGTEDWYLNDRLSNRKMKKMRILSHFSSNLFDNTAINKRFTHFYIVFVQFMQYEKPQIQFFRVF